MALESTHPLTEMNQEYFLGDKGGRCVGLQPYHFSLPIVLKTGNFKLQES
jgi:hypothetical protein